MAEKSDTLTKARSVLERTLMTLAGNLADMDQDPSVHTVEQIASQFAALQAGIEAIDKARAIAERYQTTYYGDR